MNYFANVRKPPPFPRWNDLYFDISPQDSDLWLVLYSEAKNISRALASHILFLRGSGARLIKDNRWGYVMRPDIQPGGFESPEHWRELSQKLLDPWQGVVVRLLKFLRDIHDTTLQHLGSLPNLFNQLDQCVHKTVEFSHGFGLCA